MEIAGKNILITGGARRLGREAALALADKGANIAVHYNRSKAEAEKLAEEIAGKGVRCASVRADAINPKDIRKAVEKACEDLGGLDILINNAAIFRKTPIEEITEKDWDDFLGVNLKAQFFFAREFAACYSGRRNCCPEKTGAPDIRKVINISDSYGPSPAADFLCYGVSKGGVISLTKGLAKVFAPDILVNCICLGPVMPPDGEDDAAQKRAVEATLLKRRGNPADLIKTVVFLAENDFITAQAIFVDGGRHS